MPAIPPNTHKVLVPLQGQNQRAIPLFPGGRQSTTIGRRSNNNIVISKPTTSKEHAIAIDMPTTYSIKIINLSRNGVYVNDTKHTQSVIIEPTDKINFGEAQFTYTVQTTGKEWGDSGGTVVEKS